MFSSMVLLSAVAPFVAAFVYPELVPLERRQAPGTPQYECHEDCGAVITAARTENFCESSNFTSSLDACLECANEFDIWQYYGESVSAAAESCDLDATPVAANSTSSESVASEDSASTTESSETVTDTAEATTTETSAGSTASEASESASESAASATSGGDAAAATSSEDNGIAISPGMVQLGIAFGAAVLM